MSTDKGTDSVKDYARVNRLSVLRVRFTGAVDVLVAGDKRQDAELLAKDVITSGPSANARVVSAELSVVDVVVEED